MNKEQYLKYTHILFEIKSLALDLAESEKITIEALINTRDNVQKVEDFLEKVKDKRYQEIE